VAIIRDTADDAATPIAALLNFSSIRTVADSKSGDGIEQG
jgi:hypothetical protein